MHAHALQCMVQSAWWSYSHVGPGVSSKVSWCWLVAFIQGFMCRRGWTSCKRQLSELRRVYVCN